jgi:hypothetical protein
MPGFNGTGPMGRGPMTGGGRGFCSPWGAGVSPRLYSFPRRAPYAYKGYGAYSFRPFAPRMNREQELEFLKGKAQALRDDLKELETEIGKLSAEKE